MEQRLRGGFVSDVVRVGATVRKSPPHEPAFVRRLLRWFESAGWPGAPRFLGVDEQGRETLSFVEGVVPWQPGSEFDDEKSLAAVARMTRAFHDVTAGTELAAGHEVVCHNDLSPKNTVYRGGLPVAFIDWDIAAPGRRVHDVAHMCWQFVPLGPSVEPAVAARRVRVVVDAYDGSLSPGCPSGAPPFDLSRVPGSLDSPADLPGSSVSPDCTPGAALLPPAAAPSAPISLPSDAPASLPSPSRGALVDRAEVVDVVLWWQDRCWRGIEAAAEAGDPAMVGLRDAGVAETVRAAYAWTAAHRDVLAPV